MKLTISALKFKEMLSKAVKGASNNPNLPLTQVISIKVKDEVLSLTTTDMNNYLVVKDNNCKSGDFDVVVYIDTFYKLITKITSDLITLELKDSCLEVVGDGTYKLELVLDENGKPLHLVNPVDSMDRTNRISTISLGTIKRILSGVKQSLSASNGRDESSVDCYHRYHVGSLVVASNGYVVSALDTPIFNEPKLITTDLMNILGVTTDSELAVYASTKLNGAGNEVKELLFESEHYSIYGVEVDGVGEFDINAIKGWLSQSFPSYCKLSKASVVNLLDRISLFVDKFDNDAISLTFTSQGLVVSSMASTGTESINYLSSKNHEDFSCSISIKLLAPQISAQSGDTIDLWYGDEGAIKLVDTDITSVVGLGV